MLCPIEMHAQLRPRSTCVSVNFACHAQGSNAYGQVGDGTLSTRTTPALVSYEGWWLQVATGDYHACGIRSDYSAWCWVRMRVHAC